jgi:hypothetical protein
MARSPLPGLALLLAVSSPALAADERLHVDGFELGDTCGWTSTAPPPAVAEEVEPNDVPGQAQPIGRCATVDGGIGPVDSGADFDYFAVAVSEPTLLRLTLADRDGTSDFEPYLDVDDVAQAYPPLGITPIATDSTTRQIWLPADGTWYLFVGDERNWDRASGQEVENPSIGGDEVTWRLSLRVEPLEPVDVFFPPSGEPHEIPADGSLLVLRIDPAETTEIQTIEVFAQRLVPASPLDAKLHLVRRSAAGRTTVASSDDLSDEIVDPALPSEMLAGEALLAIVDFFDVYDEEAVPQSLPAPFELTLQYPESASPRP